MSNPDDPYAPKANELPTPQPTPADLECGRISGGGVSEIVGRWKRESLLKKCLLVCRGFGFIFSFLAFIIMISNKRGGWKDYDKYEEYRYVEVISVLSALYTVLQALRQIHELSTGEEMFSRQCLAIVDFCCDQIGAYLLLSAAASAVPLTDRTREGAENIFTETSASSICMEFFAFFALAISSLVSGYKLSTRSYI